MAKLRKLVCGKRAPCLAQRFTQKMRHLSDELCWEAPRLLLKGLVKELCEGNLKIIKFRIISWSYACGQEKGKNISVYYFACLKVKQCWGKRSLAAGVPVCVFRVLNHATDFDYICYWKLALKCPVWSSFWCEGLLRLLYTFGSVEKMYKFKLMLWEFNLKAYQ